MRALDFSFIVDHQGDHRRVRGVHQGQVDSIPEAAGLTSSHITALGFPPLQEAGWVGWVEG